MAWTALLCVLAVVSGVGGQEKQSCTHADQCAYAGCGSGQWSYGCNCVNYREYGHLYSHYGSPHYALAGGASCSKCYKPQWQFCPRNCPASCSAGQYVSNCACTNCTAGFFCTGNPPVATTCPTGSYSETGQSFCTSCNAGTYLETSSSICTSCSIGKYSLASSTACTNCPAYTFGNTTGLASCFLCQGTSFSGPGATTCTTCPPA